MANDEHNMKMHDLKDGRSIHHEPFQYEKVNWKGMLTNKKNIPWWILTVFVLVLTILFTIHHDEIVASLKPAANKIKDVPGGFVIPIVILVIISFPPLFGHELIGLMVGLVYGLEQGFAIVAAGTFLGEASTWFAFLWLFRSRAEKMETTNLGYAALARITREGGFPIVLLIRLSVIPSHFSTAVFATCGVNFWYFLIATFLTLPKQIIIVYVGVLLANPNEEEDNNIVSNIILVVTVVLTISAGIYIYRQMSKVKRILLEEQANRVLDYEGKKEAAIRDRPIELTTTKFTQEQDESHDLEQVPVKQSDFV